MGPQEMQDPQNMMDINPQDMMGPQDMIQSKKESD